MKTLVLEMNMRTRGFLKSRIEKMRSEDGNAIIIGVIGMVIFISGSIALNTPIGNWITTTANSIMSWGTGLVNKVIA